MGCFDPTVVFFVLCVFQWISLPQIVGSEHACYNSVVSYNSKLYVLGLKVYVQSNTCTLYTHISIALLSSNLCILYRLSMWSPSRPGKR